MKIGLLTYHWVANYGANLQMYSTYMFLKNNGCNPIVINWVPESGKSYYNMVSGSSQIKCHQKFVQGNCITTREFSEITDFPIILEEYGITHIIVGSDSVLNIMKDKFDWFHFKRRINTIDHSYPNPFWCSDISIPHAALSVSSQNAKFKAFREIRDEIGNTLSGFKRITVRDFWTQSLVSYFTEGSIVPEITPDPVFGFNVNVKDNTTAEDIRKKFCLPAKYVLFTFNNGRMKAPLSWISAIKKLFNDAGFACVNLPRSTGSQELELDYKIDMPINPLDWYNLIRYSNGYIGVLMHPIVVCLHNAVPCYSFDHYGNGPLLFSNMKSSKIFDIMERAGILDNHYYLRNHITFPSPYSVFKKIIDFPSEKILTFSSLFESKCIDNMSRIVTSLKN